MTGQGYAIPDSVSLHPGYARWHLRLVSGAVVEQLRSDGEFQAFAKRYLERYAVQIEHLTFSEQAAVSA